MTDSLAAILFLLIVRFGYEAFKMQFGRRIAIVGTLTSLFFYFLIMIVIAR